MIWSAADIAAFLTAFGQTVVLDDGSLNGNSITGIYRQPFQSLERFDGAVETSEPSVDCASSDVSTVAHNQALRVNDTDYIVTGIENKGTGWTRLILRERFD